MINAIEIFLIAFLLGSFPTAYLTLKVFYKKDIRKEGSGNIGALNTFEVTSSKLAGLIVFAIDIGKGMLALYLTRVFFGNHLWHDAYAAIGVIAGHNFSPWVGFQGGRGLASAVGVSLLYYPLFVVYWGAGWVTGYSIWKNVHVGNLFASLWLPLLLLLVYEIGGAEALYIKDNPAPILVTAFVACTLIVLKHIKPIRELIQSKM